VFHVRCIGFSIYFVTKLLHDFLFLYYRVKSSNFWNTLEESPRILIVATSNQCSYFWGLFSFFLKPEKHDFHPNKGFLWKNDPNWPYMEFCLIIRFLQHGGQNVIRFFFKKLSHMLYSQIWLKFLVDNHQFSLVFCSARNFFPKCKK